MLRRSEFIKPRCQSMYGEVFTAEGIFSSPTLGGFLQGVARCELARDCGSV